MLLAAIVAPASAKVPGRPKCVGAAAGGVRCSESEGCSQSQHRRHQRLICEYGAALLRAPILQRTVSAWSGLMRMVKATPANGSWGENSEEAR